MTSLSSVIERLRSVAIVTPEYQGVDVFAAIQEDYEELLETYPGLKNYPDYLKFLRQTGGAHIHNQQFSLVIYGFGGYVVPSFEEGVFLDRERFFLFGEVLYTAQPDPSTLFFAFDLRSERDTVYCLVEEQSDYTPCAASFIGLLVDFAEGRYPGLRS
jgi:hypothetical protein